MKYFMQIAFGRKWKNTHFVFGQKWFQEKFFVFLDRFWSISMKDDPVLKKKLKKNFRPNNMSPAAVLWYF